MQKLKVYLSGGLESDWQDKVITACKSDFVFFNPKKHSLSDSILYTAWDIHFVKQCDILFACMDSVNPSGYGLALEFGIAVALGKTTILVDERSDVDEIFNRYFKIVHNAADVVLPNLEDGIKYLRTFIIS